MRISDQLLRDLLSKAGKATPEQLEQLAAEQGKSNRPLQDLALQHELISDVDLTKLYAEHSGIEFVSINAKELLKETVSALPERIARQYNAVVFKVDENGTKHIAMEDPEDMQAIDFIQKYIGAKFQLYLATKENILMSLESYRDGVASELDKVIEVQAEEAPATEQQVRKEDLAEDSPIAQTVNLILEYAIRSGASDIHIEPRDDMVQIRYRIDGVLQEANRVPKNVMSALVSRIKILSNLKIDEHRAPQDGRFKILISGKRYAFRVSTLPITTGEKVVMRILDEGGHALSLEDLGYWGTALSRINEAIVQPHGMILVTGPTGSGKSTSLFSVLSLLNNPTVNISTVEDPVEYRIPGANQTQVNPVAGMTFTSGLRALLRQDPNIIMVGEIRDSETADLAIQAALTGHLVFSTLHTNNAATCLPRLLEMGIEPFLIASTVRVVVGQRLVRKLCASCKQSYKPQEEELKELIRVFNIDAASFNHLHELEVVAAKAGIGKEAGEDLSSTESSLNRLWRAPEGGCNDCGKTGYKGRVGIYEVLSNTSEVQKLIVGNATSAVIQDQAIKEGMNTMQVDGLIKAFRGQTSIEEILRVTRE
jgi:type IV pilus assembly protein PilB